MTMDNNEEKQIDGVNGHIVKQHTVGPAITNIDNHAYDDATQSVYIGVDLGIPGGDKTVINNGRTYSELSQIPAIYPENFDGDTAYLTNIDPKTNTPLGARSPQIYGGIAPLFDHMPKNNKDITEANEKLKNMSAPQNDPGYLGKSGDKGIIEKDGQLLHKRTKKQYWKLWKEFLRTEALEYFESMGYSQELIERIGYEKFIDAHDWSTIKDIKKWRTDMVHVVPCAHCENEFTTYEIDLGLCSKCKEEFDLNRFVASCQANEEQEAGISFGMRAAFVFDKTFRDMYLKSNIL